MWFRVSDFHKSPLIKVSFAENTKPVTHPSAEGNLKTLAAHTEIDIYCICGDVDLVTLSMSQPTGRWSQVSLLTCVPVSALSISVRKFHQQPPDCLQQSNHDTSDAFSTVGELTGIDGVYNTGSFGWKHSTSLIYLRKTYFKIQSISVRSHKHFYP